MWVLLWMGCTTTVRFPPDLWEGQFEVDTGFGRNVFGASGFATCGVTPPEWRIESSTSGAAGGVNVTVLHRDGSREVHDLELVGSNDFDEDFFSVALAVTGGNFISGRSTRFSCADEPDLGFVARIYSRFGELTDCISFGARAFEAASAVEMEPDLVALGGCAVF